MSCLRRMEHNSGNDFAAKAGGVGAPCFVLGDEPVRVAAVAGLSVAPRTDAHDRREILGGAQPEEGGEIVLRIRGPEDAQGFLRELVAA